MEKIEDFSISDEAGLRLTKIARHSLELFLREGVQYRLELDVLPDELRRLGASFVTLSANGRLRGCIGGTEARQPLALDTAVHAVAAATRDPRFPPVTSAELPDIFLSVTVLSPMQPLAYANYETLLKTLRPYVDGVMLNWQGRRGLLLPQVWERITDPAQFLAVICRKGKIPEIELRSTPPSVGVHIFQAQYFSESGYQEPD